LRISSADYQLRYALEIATVFEAYLPFLDGQADPELRKERARVLEKAGAYFSLGGATRQAGRRLLQALAAGRPSALAFLIAATLLPKSWLSRLFREYRQLQLGGQVPPDHGKGTKLET
jgi:hypothetical protein